MLSNWSITGGRIPGVRKVVSIVSGIETRERDGQAERNVAMPLRVSEGVGRPPVLGEIMKK